MKPETGRRPLCSAPEQSHGDRGNEPLSKLVPKIPSSALCECCPWFAPEYYLGVFTVSDWKPQCALQVFFSLLLFKANGSENEQPTVTPAEMSDDWENRQMDKGCSHQADVVAAHSPALCHTGVRRHLGHAQES